MGRIKQEEALLALVLAMLGSDIPPIETASVLICACTGVNHGITKANRYHLLDTMSSVASSYRQGHACIRYKQFVNDVLGNLNTFVFIVPLTNIEDTV